MREIAQNRLYRIGYRKNYTIKGRTLRQFFEEFFSNTLPKFGVKSKISLNYGGKLAELEKKN